MSNFLLPADQLAKIRERITLLSRLANINHGEEEALAILDNLPQVEVVAWMDQYDRVIEAAEKDPRFAYTHKYEIPLYGSKQ